MDSITQASLGAAIGVAVLGKENGRRAALAGALVATIPDLDVVLLPFFSKLQGISIHRGLSHAVLFNVALGLLIAFFLSRMKWLKEIPFFKVLSFSWLALLTHILLDAFTTYGTQLWLPFSDKRVSFDSINIVDPFYTLPLIIGLTLTLFVYKTRHSRDYYNKLGLLISTIYLFSTLGVKYHVHQQFRSELKQESIHYNSLLTVPVKIGNVNWYGVAKSDSSLHIGKYSTLTRKPIQLTEFPINDHLLDPLDMELTERMKWFAKGYYVVAKEENKVRIYNMQCDMQGTREYGEYLAPTAFYFEITTLLDGDYELAVGMHPKQ